MSSSAAVNGSTVLVSARALAASSRKSSEMAEVEGERPSAGTPEIGNVPHGSKRMGDVAGKGADVGALGDGCGEGDFIQILPGTGRGTSEAGGGPDPSVSLRLHLPVPGRSLSSCTVTVRGFISMSSPARARA